MYAQLFIKEVSLDLPGEICFIAKHYVGRKYVFSIWNLYLCYYVCTYIWLFLTPNRP